MVKKKHRYILTELWQNRWFKNLSNGAKYLYLYLLTNPKSNICGVYEIMDEQVKFDTDIINLDKTFAELQQANEVVRIEDWCIILRYPLNQNWQTAWAIGDRIIKELEELPEDIIEVLRHYEYQYPPIKSDKALANERQRINKMKPNRKQTPEPIPEPEKIPLPSQKSYSPKKESFNEHVPWG